jgi:transcriptional regulator with XRE-family HTH domain
MEEMRKAFLFAVQVWPGSQSDLARKLHMDQSHLARIVRGERSVTPDVARETAELFRVVASEMEAAAQELAVELD